MGIFSRVQNFTPSLHPVHLVSMCYNCITKKQEREKMQAVLNNSFFTYQSINLIDLFKDFLKSVIDNYQKANNYNLEKRIKAIRKNIKILNDNLEELIKKKNFEKLEDEIIELKFYIEKLLNTSLPANIKKELNLLYEDLVTFDFNTSMLEMRKEVEDIRNQKI